MTLAELMTFVVDNAEVLLVAVTSIVTVASIIANFTKTETDNKVVAKISALVNLLALNLKKKPTDTTPKE